VTASINTPKAEGNEYVLLLNTAGDIRSLEGLMTKLVPVFSDSAPTLAPVISERFGPAAPHDSVSHIDNPRKFCSASAIVRPTVGTNFSGVAFVRPDLKMTPPELPHRRRRLQPH
jgi:hypothetical protein